MKQKEKEGRRGKSGIYQRSCKEQMQRRALTAAFPQRRQNAIMPSEEK
jgi:hypothetical protein